MQRAYGTNVNADWWVFDHRKDESDLLAKAVEPDELKLKNLTTGKAISAELDRLFEEIRSLEEDLSRRSSIGASAPTADNHLGL